MLVNVVNVIYSQLVVYDAGGMMLQLSLDHTLTCNINNNTLQLTTHSHSKQIIAFILLKQPPFITFLSGTTKHMGSLCVYIYNT